MGKNKIIHGYKGLDKDFKCRDFQFEEGKSYHEDDAIICKKGFHFCENPIDIFNYYPPCNSRYAEVEGSGKFDTHDIDSKISCTELKINAEIGINGIVNAGVKFILDACKKTKKATGDQSAATNTGDQSAATNTGNHSAATNTGYQSAATNTGDQSAATNTGNHSAATNTGDQSAATNTGNQSAATNTGDQSAATNTGYQSAATNTGYQSAATVEGNNSIACGTGYDCKARGKIGCWLILAERKDNMEIKSVKAVKVDGKKIKEMVFYRLRKGKFCAEK